jgi:hypothetical protein
MIIGNWNVVARLAPSATRREDGKDAGTNRIVSGPGGWSVVENGRTDGDSGSRNALGIIWGDEKAPGFRTMFYDNGFATMGIERVARCMTVWARGKAVSLFLSSGFIATATRLTE